MKSKYYEDSCYVMFSNLLLLPLSLIQIFLLAPSSHTTSIYVLLLEEQTMELYTLNTRIIT